MTRKEFAFISVSTGALALAALLIANILPNGVPSIDAPRTEKSKRMEAPYGHPDLFAEHFADIQGLNSGYDAAPHNNKMIEFTRAVQRAAKRGQSRQLNWVERGPGTVGGRTRAIVVDPDDPSLNTWYVGAVGGGVWKGVRAIDNYGAEVVDWTPLTDHLPNLNVSALAMAESDPDVMYVGTGEGFFNVDAGAGLGMFKTTDRGVTWTQLASTAVSSDNGWRFINRIAIDPDDADVVVVATNSGIYRTTDGGNSFDKVYDSDGDRVQDLRARPDDFNVQYAGVNSVTVLKSTDGGVTWSESLNNVITGLGRIELAISPSHPDVVYASVDYDGGVLYRTTDGGDNWLLVEDAAETNVPYLGAQGWYDNTIAVHPFSPDTVFLGGILRWKSWITEGTESVTAINELNVPAGFFGAFVNFGAPLFGGVLQAGYNDEDAVDITLEQTVSVEVRFGQGSQKAHRFAVSPNGGANGDGGAGIPFAQYQYRGYVDVPFQVWDTDNNRQLMVSFRDQADDGAYNLIEFNTAGGRDLHSREYLFIHRYDYDDTNAHADIAANGGLVNGMMYFMWPILGAEEIWDPAALPSVSFSINVIRADVPLRAMEIWENGVVHVDHHNITILPIDETENEYHILNGNDGGFAYSRDSGVIWLEGDQSRGYNTSQFYDATKRPGYNIYLGGTQDNGTWRSYNNANNRRGWLSSLGGDGFDVIWKSQGGGDSLIGSIQFNNIQRSLDGGVNWEAAVEGLDDVGPNGQFLSSLNSSVERPDHVFTIGSSGVWHSTDFAGTWNLRAIPTNRWQRNSSNGKVRVSLADPDVVWAGYRLRSPDGLGTLHVSTNGGRTFAPVTLPPETIASNAPISGLATHPFSRGTAYAMFSVYGWPKILRTTDMGSSWEDITDFDASTGESTNGFPNVQVYDLAVFPEIPRIIWAGTDVGLFESRDHGETWHYADNGLPAASIWRIRIVDGQVVLATHGRGVWSLDLTEVQTNIEETVEVPGVIELEGNYPNPFNPSTTIAFKLSAESHVTMTVFDVLGRRVATLTDQPYASGRHLLNWDASALASGQYFYRLEVDGQIVESRSMHLLK